MDKSSTAYNFTVTVAAGVYMVATGVMGVAALKNGLQCAIRNKALGQFLAERLGGAAVGMAKGVVQTAVLSHGRAEA